MIFHIIIKLRVDRTVFKEYQKNFNFFMQFRKVPSKNLQKNERFLKFFKHVSIVVAAPHHRQLQNSKRVEFLILSAYVLFRIFLVVKRIRSTIQFHIKFYRKSAVAQPRGSQLGNRLLHSRIYPLKVFKGFVQ